MPTANQGAPNRILITIIVMSAAIMQVLDTTIVNVAIPNMQGALNASPDEISWVLTCYLVSSAICMPLTAYFADRLGRKTFLLISIIGFTIASMFCGLADSLGELIIFRILQGVFGASLVPLSQAIIADIYPLPERGVAMSIWGAGIMLGPILGPTLGGYFSEYFNWRWNFYVNLPVGTLAIIGTIYFVEQTEPRERKLDWISYFLIAIGIGTLQFSLDRGSQSGWFDSKLILTTVCIAASSFIVFVLYSKMFPKNSIFSLKVITNRNFYVSSIIMGYLSLCFYGSIVLQPLMLSNLYNYPEFTTGLVLGIRGVASFMAMIIVGKIIHKVHPRNIILLGLVINMLGNYICTFYTLEASMRWIIYPIILQGIGIGLSFIPLSIMCLSTMPKPYMNEAAGLFSLTRIMGASMGVSILITYFSRRTQGVWGQLGGHINMFSDKVQEYLQGLNLLPMEPMATQILGYELAQHAQMQAIIDSFYLLSVSFLAILPLALFFEREKKLVDASTIVNH